MDLSDIELEPLVGDEDTPRRPDPGHHRLRSVAVLAALVATGALAVPVIRNDDRQAPPVEAAPAAIVLPAPSRTVAAPPATRPSRFSIAYAACMFDAGGSADSMEHRAVSCRREAETILHDERLVAACMRNLGGTADSLERRADECQSETEAHSAISVPHPGTAATEISGQQPESAQVR